MSGTTYPVDDIRRLGAAVERKQLPMADAAAELVDAFKARDLTITLAGAEVSLRYWRNDGVDPQLETWRQS